MKYMAITKEEILNLAKLSRMEIADSEAENLRSEIEPILAYVSQIQEISEVGTDEIAKVRNVMRDDIVTHNPLEYTEDILNSAPAREGNYLKVKKILE